MKKYSTVYILVFLLALSGCSETKRSAVSLMQEESLNTQESSTDFSEQSTWLLGYFNLPRMLYAPHSEWYNSEFDRYQPGQKVVDKLALRISEDITIKIVLGTWCPDSRREVPRFMKLLDALKFPVEKTTFIGVDNMKLSPVGEYESLGIERVPTFIVYKNNIEAGRIIENPVTSLEQDMLDILIRNE